VFGAKVGASASNTITIRPAANFSTVTLTTSVGNQAVIELEDADYLILDGRPGGVGNTRAIILKCTANNGTVISLKNSATYNTIRYLQLQHEGTLGRTVGLLYSLTSPAGNSNNRIEFNLSTGSAYGFHSQGILLRLNRDNVFYGNEIRNTTYSGIYIEEGTGNILIDSNVIYSTATPSTYPIYGIVFGEQTDTAIIRNNQIYDIITSNASAIRGILIRNTALTGVNYTEIYNNFISLNTPGSGSTSVIGLEYTCYWPVIAKIWHNTIQIYGSISSGGFSGYVLSAALSISDSHTSSSYELKNNIFNNSRSGGNPSGQHLALSLANTAGTYVLDYNTYRSGGLLTRFGTATQQTVAAFASALGGNNEANGNTTPVQFTGINDLTLTGTSLGNANLGGTSIARVSTDRFGNSRSNVPYRGAHEASPSLAGTSSVNETNESFQVKIYPNPATDQVFIVGSELGFKLRIFDLQGRLVFEDVTPNSQLEIEVGRLKVGVYTIEVIQADGKRNVQRLLKQ